MALVAGLLLGAALKPDLMADDRPAGPQMFTDTDIEQATGPFDDRVSYAGYSGPVPDYVLGTDWKKLAHRAAEPPPPPTPNYDLAELEKLRLSDIPGADYRDESGSEAQPAADIDSEAPPEATGDTTPATG